MNELKPCPFCGREAEHHGECDMVRVQCSVCGANTSGWWDEPAEAAEDWNRRAEPEARELTLDELREMDGMPVWVKKNVGIRGAWALLTVLCEEIMAHTSHGTDLFAADYGKTWLAYDRQPKGE